jgi:hypothetical protein
MKPLAAPLAAVARAKEGLTEVFLRKILKMYFPQKWGNKRTNGTIRKCYSRAFQ